MKTVTINGKGKKGTEFKYNGVRVITKSGTIPLPAWTNRSDVQFIFDVGEDTGKPVRIKEEPRRRMTGKDLDGRDRFFFGLGLAVWPVLYWLTAL